MYVEWVESWAWVLLLRVKGWRRAVYRAAASGMRVTSSSPQTPSALGPTILEARGHAKRRGMPQYLDKRIKSRGEPSIARSFSNLYPLCCLSMRIFVNMFEPNVYFYGYINYNFFYINKNHAYLSDSMKYPTSVKRMLQVSGTSGNRHRRNGTMRCRSTGTENLKISRDLFLNKRFIKKK